MRSARMILVEIYLPPAERAALYALVGGMAQSPEFQKDLHALSKQAAEAAVKQGRSARFGVQVVCGYHHTCALTGYRIVTQSGESVVEAAHIEPWAKTRHDDVTNGLALSRNAHWAFDRGMWSVGAESRILIQPERSKEWGPGDLGLAKYRGQSLQFAPQSTLRPRAEYLKEHPQLWGF
jgi:putative restriction endonuclease